MVRQKQKFFYLTSCISDYRAATEAQSLCVLCDKKELLQEVYLTNVNSRERKENQSRTL